MGAVKNHYHDEICAMPESDEPVMSMADLTPAQITEAAKVMVAGAASEMPDCVDQRLSQRGKDILRTVIETKIFEYLWGLQRAAFFQRQAERLRDPLNDYDPVF